MANRIEIMLGVAGRFIAAQQKKALAVMAHQRFIPTIALLGLFAATTAVITQVYPNRIAYNPQHGTFLDSIFASRAVVGGLRVAILYAIVFLGISIVMRIWNGHWLRKAGPFEIAEPVKDIVSNLHDENEFLQKKVEDGEKNIRKLKRQLAEADGVLRKLYEKAKAEGAGS